MLPAAQCLRIHRIALSDLLGNIVLAKGELGLDAVRDVERIVLLCHFTERRAEQEADLPLFLRDEEEDGLAPCRILQLPVRKELLREAVRIDVPERRHGDDEELRPRRVREVAAHPLNRFRVLGHQYVAKVRHRAEMCGLCGDAERRAETFEPHAVLRTRLLCERDVRLQNCGGVVFLAELSLHRVENAAGVAVRDCALQAIADFDAKRAVVLCDEQEHAVIHACIADAPTAKQFVRVRLDVCGAERRYGDDDDLRLCFAAQLRSDF